MRALWGHYEGIEGAKMIDVILGFIVSLNIIVITHLYFKTNAIEKAISDGIDNVEIEIPGLDSIKDEMEHTIVSLLQGMHTPTFMDHIGGAIGTMIQARTAKMMSMGQEDGLIPEQSNL